MILAPIHKHDILIICKTLHGNENLRNANFYINNSRLCLHPVSHTFPKTNKTVRYRHKISYRLQFLFTCHNFMLCMSVH